MARLVWTEPASFDLIAIAEYIELENPLAARKLVQKILDHTEKLIKFPKLGKVWQESPENMYRELVISPRRLFYRIDRSTIYIVAVMRMERDARSILDAF